MVELLFSVAIVVLILSGVVALLVSSIGSRNKGYDRKRAVYIAEKAMEGLVNQKGTTPDVFWAITTYTGNDEGYSYRVTLESQNKCTSPVTCKELEIIVSVPGADTSQQVKLRRLFVK